MAADDSQDEDAFFDQTAHLRYWKMCYKGPLPHHYLPNESNRMALAYFMLMSIDMLTPASTNPLSPRTPDVTMQKVRHPLMPPQDQPRLRAWILAHQHPSGGFCGSPSTTPPRAQWNLQSWQPGTSEGEAPECWGHAQLPATVFALQMLAMLSKDADDAESAFRGIDRVRTLRWLGRLQREDGSFGENTVKLPGKGWFIGGGYDMRSCYLAAAARWMLRGDIHEGEDGWVEDFDVDRLANFIARSQTYDGGLAGGSANEPHAGYTYCAVGALSLLDRPLEGSRGAHPSKRRDESLQSIPILAHWLASRQFVYLEPTDDDDEVISPPDVCESLTIDEKEPRYVGFNGRCNKHVDSCYCWWMSASLANLGEADQILRRPVRRFLLEKMQHRIGGFGKYVGDPPDIYHSFLGLAALASMGEPGLKEFDTSLAVTAETVLKIETARRALLERESRGRMKNALVGRFLNTAFEMNGGKPSWMAAMGE